MQTRLHGRAVSLRTTSPPGQLHYNTIIKRYKEQFLYHFDSESSPTSQNWLEHQNAFKPFVCILGNILLNIYAKIQ